MADSGKTHFVGDDCEGGHRTPVYDVLNLGMDLSIVHVKAARLAALEAVAAAALARREATRAINALEKDFRELPHEEAVKKHLAGNRDGLTVLYEQRNAEWREADRNFQKALDAIGKS